MPERTPQTAPAPAPVAESAATTPAVPAATPAAARDPVDTVTGMPEPMPSSVDPRTRDLPAPLPTALPAFPSYLLSGSALLLGGLALLASALLYRQLRRSHCELSKQVKELKSRLAALDLGQTLDSLASRNTAQDPLPTWPGASSAPPSNPVLLSQPSSALAEPPASLPEPLPPLLQKPSSQPAGVPSDVVVTAEPQPSLSKALLIQALNNGDRQLLREHTSAQLNITSDSEHALAMGRTQPTQLEAVSGGGSYWLATIGDQAWLFPTELTLKGYLSLQPSKGLYSYEKQIIGKPQLIEPALLRQDGQRWTVEILGRVAIP